jgi:mRNA interferase MazF
MSFVPDRGDAILITLTPQAGHEQAGRRPALVLTPRAYNEKVGLVVACPITNQVKGFPFEVVIPTGMAVNGAILSDHVKSLDWRARNAEHICPVPAATLAEVLAKLNILLALPAA